MLVSQRVSARETGAQNSPDCGGRGGPLQECLLVKLSDDKVVVVMDSAEISRVSNQVTVL